MSAEVLISRVCDICISSVNCPNMKNMEHVDEVRSKNKVEIIAMKTYLLGKTDRSCRRIDEVRNSLEKSQRQFA